ncbi:MAG TPA: hypothetical protein VFL83_20635 [Anaeromyxobacter sp.]|nr:hypothetical protein [Anaeromyxobacter sp.]
MTTFALALAAIVIAAPPAKPPVDCAREIADARQLYEDHAADSLRFADPLARAVHQVIDRTLRDEDRAAIRAFKQGTVTAAELDARLWPRLRRVFARFNSADCRHLGGVARSEEVVDALTAMRGGQGLHTDVLISCVRRLPGLESRSHLGLRVRRDEDGPTLVLQGVIERPQTVMWAAGAPPEVRRVAVQIPLGDRDAERQALAQTMAGYAGSESDFTWIVPASCGKAITIGYAAP